MIPSEILMLMFLEMVVHVHAYLYVYACKMMCVEIHKLVVHSRVPSDVEPVIRRSGL